MAVVLLVVGVVAVPLAMRFIQGKSGNAGERALDESSRTSNAKRYPVHPPRGERSVSRSGTGVQIESVPIACAGAGTEITRGNVELTITAEHAAVIYDGCLLQLVNVDLTANDGIILEGGRLEMINGSIEARGIAIQAGGDATVELTNVEVKGNSAVQASGSARVSASGGAVRGSGAAIVARDQAQVALVDIEVDGPIARDKAAKVTVDGVESPSED